jgi:peptidoglycan/LPS O-acetylase OafA/YrhL
MNPSTQHPAATQPALNKEPAEIPEAVRNETQATTAADGQAGIAVPPPRRFFLALTSLRFFAAGLVVMFHSAKIFGLDAMFANQVFASGVSIFFIMSGFFLTYAYPELNSTSERKRFLFSRFFRLWPTHILTMFLMLILLPKPYPPQHAVPVTLLNATMLHAWVPFSVVYDSWNDVSWSISTEFAFYFFFPLLIYRLDRSWHFKLVGTLLMTIVLIGCVNAFHLQTSDAYRGVSAKGLLFVFPLARLFEFTLGMTVALFWRDRVSRLQWSVQMATGLEILAIALVVIAMWLNLAIANRLVKVIGGGGKYWLMHSGITCLPFAFLIFVLATEGGYVSRAMSLRGLVLLGEMSYTIYLVHKPLIRYFESHNTVLLDRLSTPGLAVVFAAVLLLMSHAIWSGVEKPVRRLFQAWWPKPGFKPVPPPSVEPPVRRSLVDYILAPTLRTGVCEVAAVAIVVLPCLLIVPKNPKRAPQVDLAAETLFKEKKLPVWLKQLKNKQAPKVRQEAAHALAAATANDPVVFDDLAETLKDKVADVRAAAAKSLGTLGERGELESDHAAVIDGLIAALGDDSLKVREAAVKSLGQIKPGTEPVAKELGKILKDKEQSDETRLAAANALKNLGPEAAAAIPDLKAAQAGANDNLKEAILDALKDIEGGQ